jgi:KaiC/GvpD/RAD55 family RecA-like ATPase/CheY-like chemotaxis protein
MGGSPRTPLLERALGGLIPGRAYLVHGQPGVGKTILGLQATHAWSQAGHRVVYLTSGRAEDLLEQASLLGLSLDAAWRDGRLALCPFAPRAARQVRERGIDEFLARLHEQGGGDENTLVVFDPVPLPFADLRGAQAARAVGQLMARLREWGWTALFLGRSGRLRRHGLLDALSEHCWGVITLERVRPSRGADRSPFALRVVRSRQSVPAGTVVPYAIALEAGLIPAPETPEEGASAAVGSRPRRQRALIACGERDPFEPLIGLLRYAMDIEVVGDGVAALSRAATWQPEVVVLQSDLPRLSGLAVTRALRQGGYGMPIVVLSGGERRRSDRVRALLCGATDFIESAFDLREAAFRVHMASRMRVAPPQAGAEERRLESLIEKGRQAVVEEAEFLELLDLTVKRGARFSSPVSVVAFAFADAEATAREMALWSRFRGTLGRSVRAGDLVCFPSPQRAATLLCHETRSGARAFTERVCERVAREFGTAAMQLLQGRLRVAHWTLEGDLAEGADPGRLLEAAFLRARPVAVDDEDREAPATGTDGR